VLRSLLCIVCVESFSYCCHVHSCWGHWQSLAVYGCSDGGSAGAQDCLAVFVVWAGDTWRAGVILSSWLVDSLGHGFRCA